MDFLKKHWRPIVIGAAVVALWLLLRTPAAPLASVAELEARLARGEPLVLELFTNT